MIKKEKFVSFTTFIFLFLIFFLLIYFNSFYFLRNSLSDRLYGGDKTLDNILIVKIDDYSINKIGRWPWDRDVFAEILNKTSDAKVVGVDVSFFEKSSSDEELKKVLEKNSNIILASEIIDGALIKPIFNASTGYVNLITDSDGVTRSFDTSLNQSTEHFGVEIFKKINPNKKIESKKYLINFASAPNSFNSISSYDVLNNQDNKLFEDKIILIGATAPDLHDTFFVPTSNGIAMPGAEIHANILQNFYLDNFLQNQGKFSIFLFSVVVSVLCFFFLSRIKIYYILPILILFLLAYCVSAVYLFSKMHYILDLFFIPLSVLLFTGSGAAVNYLEEKNQRVYLKNAFGRYVSKDLLKEIVEKKQKLKLGGSKREITIFFSDIRGFTSISEKLSPEELVELMNEYLSEMTKVILKNKGTVDKFIGDAIMAFWNAPLEEKEHSFYACASALEQIKELEKVNDSLKKRNLPVIEIGCGIHTGDAIVGNMGSEDRFDYTAIGDSVNLASRLEGLTKQYGVRIIISESTYKKVKEKFKFRKLDKVKVKGKNFAIEIYELCVGENSELNNIYEKALKFYFDKDFKKAKKEFEKCLKIKLDRASVLFIERCKQYIKNPPAEDWDGSFVHINK